MRQLGQLQLKDDEPLHEYTIRAQELIRRLGQAGEQISETLQCDGPGRLPGRYEQFVIQSFTPTNNFLETQND